MRLSIEIFIKKNAWATTNNTRKPIKDDNTQTRGVDKSRDFRPRLHFHQKDSCFFFAFFPFFYEVFFYTFLLVRTSSARAFFFFLLSAESGTHCCHCTASGLPLSAPQWRRSGRTVSRSIPSTEDGEEKKKSVPGPPVEKTITRQAGAFDPPPQPTAKKGEKKPPKIQKKKEKEKSATGQTATGC